ncbi:hypothetical protein KP509_37G069100 [Ceratopteris richardii]|uniref:IMS import disulfide relay-system CHCH-CHCH-like Cx9C domain-containing protein n=1 Tax=Ceratopteris richardii TaxID=49495 RepID=A0A8T2Q9M2_CERRI|nr:hypothetical protein KP509_37G069100 [Ceratopteris richardii]
MGKAPRPEKIPTNFRQVFVNCSCELKTYGQCVAAKVPTIEQGMCSEEFLALNRCIIEVLKSKKT